MTLPRHLLEMPSGAFCKRSNQKTGIGRLNGVQYPQKSPPSWFLSVSQQRRFLFHQNDKCTSTEWQRDPPTFFKSSANFQRIPFQLPLASLHQYLSSPVRVTNVRLDPGTFHSPSLDPLSFELIIWHIPANLDPTYHQNHAQEFDGLREWFLRVQGDDMCDGRLIGDLRTVYRGWALSDDSDAAKTDLHSATSLCDDGLANINHNLDQVGGEPVSCELPDGKSQIESSPDQPIESTHVFLLWWKDEEAEARFKDPLKKGLAGGLREFGRREWKTGFEHIQEMWINEGMIVEKYSLALRFWFDLW